MEDFFTQKIILNGKHQQLIDLNKDKVNFSCEFTITPNIMDLDKPYYATVVTQEQLDNDESIDFKKMNGIHVGSVSNESNQYQNYFLVIKSDSPMRESTIENKIRELQTYTEEPPPQQIEMEMEQPRELVQRKLNPIEPPESNNKNIKYFILFFVLVAGGFLLYYFWKKGKKINLSIPFFEKQKENLNFRTSPERFKRFEKSPIRLHKNSSSNEKHFEPSEKRHFESFKQNDNNTQQRMFKPASPAVSSASEMSVQGKSPQFSFD